MAFPRLSTPAIVNAAPDDRTTALRPLPFALSLACGPWLSVLDLVSNTP